MPTVGQGLMTAGSALAQAIMQRKMMKQRDQRMMELAELLAGPEMQAQKIPGYQQDMDLVNSLVPQAPLKPLSPMDPSKEAPMGYNLPEAQGAVRGQYEQFANQGNQQRELVKALMMSGNPQAEQVALSMVMPQEQKVTPVTGGYVDGSGEFHRTEQTKPDYSRFDVISVGDKDQLVDYSRLDRAGKPMVLAEGEDLKDKNEVWTDAGNNMEQGWIRDPRSGELQPLQLPDGSPALRSTVKKIDQTNIDPIKSDPSYRRMMELDKEVMQNSLSRLDDIAARYNPIFQTWVGRAAAAGASAISKLDITGALRPMYEDYLEDFTAFQRAVNENANLYIKEITGAQMSEAEAARLMKAIMNLQDNPVGFESKLTAMKAKVKQQLERKEQIITDLLSENPELGYEKARQQAERVLGSQQANIEREMVDAFVNASGGGRGGRGQNSAGPKPSWGEWDLSPDGTSWIPRR